MKDSIANFVIGVMCVILILFACDLHSQVSILKWKIEGLEKSRTTLIKRLNKIPGTAIVNGE